jgi:hypothetical protein
VYIEVACLKYVSIPHDFCKCAAAVIKYLKSPVLKVLCTNVQYGLNDAVCGSTQNRKANANKSIIVKAFLIIDFGFPTQWSPKGEISISSFNEIDAEFVWIAINKHRVVLNLFHPKFLSSVLFKVNYGFNFFNDF